MFDPSVIRVLNDPSLDGPTNMARDEALLTGVGAGHSPPTLRLYQWDPPTISLGYFQRFADYEALPPPAGRLAVVRRPTGGGAILHDLELTYSLVLPIRHPLLSGGPNRLYEVTHQAIIASLEELQSSPRMCGVTDDSGAARGPFFCFVRRHCYDVLIGGEKIAGSAQRRTRTAVLQHGSIVLDNRFPQQPTARLSDERIPHGSQTDDSGPDAERIGPLRISLVVHLSRLTELKLYAADWAESELERSRDLIPKFAGDAWTKRS